MRTLLLFVIAALTLLNLDNAAEAQDIRVVMQPMTVPPTDPVIIGTFASGSAIDVNVGEVSGETLLRIFDLNPSGDIAVHSVGRVTITGHLATVGGRLSLLIAPAAQAIPNDPAVVLLNGVADFGTPTSAGLLIIDDGGTNLRDSTRLVMAVSGDIRGEIDVGSVFRVQDQGVFDPTTHARISGGTIFANITSHAVDQIDVERVVTIDPDGHTVITSFDAIAYIQGSWAITGTITARNDLAGPSSISRVFCG